MKTTAWILASVALGLPLTGCGGDDGMAGSGGKAGSGGTAATGGSGGVGGGGGTAATGGSGGAGATGGAAGSGGGSAAKSFKVTIENLSGKSAAPSPFSPGVWAVSAASDPLYTDGQPDRGDGLEEIAEEGDPSVLGPALMADTNVAGSGVFDTPVGATDKGPAKPGQSFELTVTAEPGQKLSFASMYGQSNDTIVSAQNIELFDASGNPLAEHEATAEVDTWDVGTEHNQAPEMGPDQAPRQAAAGSGAMESVLSKLTDTTRALPIASRIVNVTVTENGGTYSIKIENVSAASGAITTPIAPVFFAVHDASWSLFTEGGTASSGLEHLAEDGSPASLVTDTTGQTGVKDVGAVTIIDGGSGAGPALPGESFTVMATPDATHPMLSFGSMVGQTNDAFIALPPSGVALLDASGNPRPAADVQADIQRWVSVWDAGTEANQPPGLGLTQAPRQSAPNTGPADPNDQVRRYADSTNDLEGPSLGGFVSLSIVNTTTAGQFEVTVTNTSDTMAYTGKVSPVVWALHDTSFDFFKVGMPASMEIEHIAEDGNGTALATMLSSASGVGTSGVANMAKGSSSAGPLSPGDSYVFTLTPDSAHPMFELAAMVAPSSDTFLALDPGGIALLDSSGAPRTDAEIASDVAAHLFAWDAGTEINESGGSGPDQAGHQPAPDTGPAQGNGLVRLSSQNPVWVLPPASALVKVTITPMN